MASSTAGSPRSAAMSASSTASRSAGIEGPPAAHQVLDRGVQGLARAREAGLQAVEGTHQGRAEGGGHSSAFSSSRARAECQRQTARLASGARDTMR